MLPKEYQWLEKEPGPKMIIEALKLFGITEKVGEASNPAILAWAKECRINDYSADSIPWCGLFMAVVAQRAGKYLPAYALRARAWTKWGDIAQEAELGDVLVFSRGTASGHVGLYVGEDEVGYHILGGNQGDKVSIVRIAKSRCIAVRRHYATAKPSNVRKIRLNPSGMLSINEA